MAKIKSIDAGYQRHSEYQHYMESGFAQTKAKPLPLGRIVKWVVIALAVLGAWPAFNLLLSIT